MERTSDGLRLMIACSEEKHTREIEQYAKDMGIFSEIISSDNGEEALNLFFEKEPDVFVVDIILPAIDGIGILEKLHQENKKGKAKVLIMSNIGADFFVKKSFSLGADYFFVKPVYYEMFKNRVIDLLRSGAKPIGFVVKRNTLKLVVSEIIQKLGLPVGSKGYVCARFGILSIIRDPSLMENITIRLYPLIAEEFNTTPQRVERNIRHAIEVAWGKGDIRYIEKLFGYTVDEDKGKPTNSAFLATIADYVMLNYTDLY